MYKGVSKLAKLIKIMAKDVAKESSYWKVEHIGPAIGLNTEESNQNEISVKDDSGYRSITIGDTSGNRGYMLLYSENCGYSWGSDLCRVWKYRCFPPQKEIEDRLQKVIDKIPLIPMDKDNCDSDEFWYADRDDKTLTYLSDVVKKYADTIANDSRTPEEIFADCQ